MAVSDSRSSALPPLCHNPPPEYSDLYGKRREMAKCVMLEREIGFLEEELKSAESVQRSSRCCKEVAEFVIATSDPLIPICPKNKRSCHFWKWLCNSSCFSCSWFCCKRCRLELELPGCSDCNLCICPCKSCKCRCPSCADCSCTACKCSCFRCPKVRRCCTWSKSCCNPCCL